MSNQGENNIKLGAFVLTGLLVLVLSFYMIGKNHNLFGSDFRLKAHFSNLNGLIEGNNVLFSGLQAGSVKSIEIINDTTIEVILLIDNKLKPYIHKNAVASIGTEGLMGNKIVNITPSKKAGQKVEDGNLLPTEKIVNTEEMLQTLSKTNNNVAVISDALKGTILRINSSALMDLIGNKNLGTSIRSSLRNINDATAKADEMTYGLNEFVTQIRKGKGNVGMLLTDTSMAYNLKEAVVMIRSAGDNANRITIQLNNVINTLNNDISTGKGSINRLLKDTVMARNLSKSMDNIQKGTDGFKQDMEALKHNFLLRGYFKKLEKQQLKEKEAKQKKVKDSVDN